MPIRNILFVPLYTVAPYDVIVTGTNTYRHGSQIQLNCSSEGGPQLEYNWSSPNSSYTTTNNLTINNVATLDGGNYTCTVTNDAGSSSNTVTVYGESHNIICACVMVYRDVARKIIITEANYDHELITKSIKAFHIAIRISNAWQVGVRHSYVPQNSKHQFAEVSGHALPSLKLSFYQLRLTTMINVYCYKNSK